MKDEGGRMNQEAFLIPPSSYPSSVILPNHGSDDERMATTTNKQRLLTQLFTVLKKKGEHAEPEARPLLEQLLYAICRENATRDLADRAYQNLKGQFFDWNEVRVSSPHEVEEALADLPEPARRA